jgi:hypothetical protein
MSVSRRAIVRHPSVSAVVGVEIEPWRQVSAWWWKSMASITHLARARTQASLGEPTDVWSYAIEGSYAFPTGCAIVVAAGRHVEIVRA